MKVYYEAYGCTLNLSETEMYADHLRNRDEIVNTPEKADIIILGTCIVIQQTEHRMLRRIKELSKFKKRIVVTGCLPVVRKSLIDEFSDIEIVKPLEMIDYMHIPKMNRVYTAIPIAQGCVGNCAYCITKQARGEIKSYSVDIIVDMVKQSVKKGYKEIRITAQDTTSYGLDIKKNLVNLLNQIISVEGDFKIRVGMMNPRTLYPILSDIIETYKNEKIFKFLHVPVQSGDNGILKDMKRGYTTKQFNEIVNAFKSEFDTMTLSTDVIVGFPTENEQTFKNTMDLMSNIQPDMINITRYSPRPGTSAFCLKHLPSNNIKTWSQKLTDLHKKIRLEKNKKFIGKTLEILITEEGKNNTFMGRTSFYKPVIIEKNLLLGSIHSTKIIDAKKAYLIGTI